MQIICSYSSTDPSFSLLKETPYISIDKGQRTATVTVQPDDSSVLQETLNELPFVTLKFSLPGYFNFPLGSYITFKGERYTLLTPPDIEKLSPSNFTYTATFECQWHEMADRMFVNHVDHRVKFSMCARPSEFIDEVLWSCPNKPLRTFRVGADTIDLPERTVEFDKATVLDALKTIADAFDCDFTIKASGNFVDVSLVRLALHSDDPAKLSYHTGGLLPGIQQKTEGKPCTRLYVQGGERNIDRSKYGGTGSDFPEYPLSSPTLLLPSAQTLRFDGQHFEGEDGFVSSRARTYISDSEGRYIQRQYPAPSDNTREEAIELADCYPSYIGKVTSVRVANPDKNYYDFADTNIPEALDYSKCLIAGGGEMKVVFQSGMLAGREFSAKYFHTGRRFELQPYEEDGITLPGESFVPAVGDRYIVTGCTLPKAYICDNTTKTGSSWTMMRQAVRHLFDIEEQKLTISAQIQPLWGKRHASLIDQTIIPGAYVHFSDPQFNPAGINIRIKGVKTPINTPYAPELELTNAVSRSSYLLDRLRGVESTAQAATRGVAIGSRQHTLMRSDIEARVAAAIGTSLTVIDERNIDQYLKPFSSGSSMMTLDYSKLGGGAIFEGNLSGRFSGAIVMPSLSSSNASSFSSLAARMQIGSRFVLYNRSNTYIGVTGLCYWDGANTSASKGIKPGECASGVCEAITTNPLSVGWRFTTTSIKE